MTTTPGLVGLAGTAQRFSLPFLDGVLALSGADTGGSLAVLEMRIKPHSGPDAHLHRDQDEMFHVLEGGYLFRVDNDVVECGPGDWIRVPKGMPHQLTAGAEGGRHLTFFTPAGPEQWFLEAPVAFRHGMVDTVLLDALYAKYGIETIKEG